MLLQSDKEVGFVVLLKGWFNEKVLAAVNKNFVPIRKSANRVKFIEFCKSLDLTTLAKKNQEQQRKQFDDFLYRENAQAQDSFQNYC